MSKESRCQDFPGRAAIDPAQLMSQYAQMNIDLMQAAMKSLSPVMSAWADMYQGLLTPEMKKAYEDLASSMKSKTCCDIPEKGCPPRCVCKIRWDASQGERRRATVSIRNTSSDPIVYQLSATPFESCGKQIDFQPSVTPSTLSAAPGQTVTATVEVDVGQQFQPGVCYEAEVLVRGKYERCVKVELCVRCGDDCCFDHGDIPLRVTADQWYRHFQCSEPCFEPITSRPNPTPPPTNPNPPAGTVPGPAAKARRGKK